MSSPATSTSEVGPGTVIDETYRIERMLGQGGMGIVYEAQHLRVPRRVAIKLLRDQPDPSLLARFRQEAEVTSRLRHDGIVDVMDFNTLPSGASYIVMELLDGESLASRIGQGPMSVEDTLGIVRQIAAALHAAHCAGVVHRDMKPENVFLTKRERDGVLVDHVTLLDFGISKVHGSSVIRTNENVVLGTPRYMAPEQALGRNDDIDPRADQFALGVIAYEMLTGLPPFDSQNTTQVMFQIAYEKPVTLSTRRPDLPESVVAPIARAMSKQPADRFPDLSAFVLALTGRPLAQSDRSSYPVLSAARLPDVTDRGAETVDSRPRARVDQDIGERATVPDKPAQLAAPAPVRSRRGVLLAVVGGSVIAAAAVAALVLGRPDTPRPQPDAVPAVIADAAGVVVAADAESVVPVPVAVDAPVPASDAAVMHDAAVRHDAHVARTPTAPMDEDLADAIKAFKEGRYDEAVNAAKRSLRTTQSPRAYEVLVETACVRRDLAAAHSWMRNVSASHWPRLKLLCSKHGFELTNP